MVFTLLYTVRQYGVTSKVGMGCLGALFGSIGIAAFLNRGHAPAHGAPAHGAPASQVDLQVKRARVR